MAQYGGPTATGGGTGLSASGSVPAGGDRGVVCAAAARYGVPCGILWGVYGMETSYGSNLSTSSAGARGPFQFLPSTANSYGGSRCYSAGVGPAADCAAHYLSDLYRQHGGSWDAALHAYSGGGYGLSQVQAKAQGGPTSGGLSAAGSVGAGGGGGPSVGSLLSLLFDPGVYLRIGKVLFGVALLFFGMLALVKQTQGGRDLARTVGL